MNCPLQTGGNAEYLLDYAAGKLNAELLAQMEQHMTTCLACREFAGGQEAVWQALDSWEPAAVSMDFDRRLYQRIEQQQQQMSWWARLTQPLNPLVRHAVPISAAAGVMLMAGLLLFRPAAVPVTPQPQSAQVEALPPEQVQTALEDMEALREFNQLVRPDNAVEPKM